MKTVSSVTWILTCCFAISWNGEFSKASNSPESSSGGQSRQKRSVVTLYEMVSCATDCNPISFKGYGCYCGFLGKGTPVDGLDKCCQQHDRCYGYASVCGRGEHYIAPYKFQCNYGRPVCATNGLISDYGTCGHRLCECDIAFVHCIRKYGCPTSKALCKDAPWRYIANRISAAAHRSDTHYN